MKNFLYPDYETSLLARGYKYIIGIDEVGRGCLAGPTAIGVYIYSKDSEFIEGINDSKKVSEKNRNILSNKLNNHNFKIYLGDISVINSKGIGKTIEELIQNAVNEFNSIYLKESVIFLIDGQFSSKFSDNCIKIIKGDSKIYSIAAASILAKVYRDNLMKELDTNYPGYNFSKHKGYGTVEHLDAIKNLGLSEIHRIGYNIKGINI